MYEYRASLIRVVDGDTIDVELDLGLRIKRTERLRLLGVDAPEMHGDEQVRAEDVRDELQRFLAEANEMRVHTEKTGSFGRWLAKVRVRYGNEWYDVVEWLVSCGMGERR
jgi:micrococcal nuclease